MSLCSCGCDPKKAQYFCCLCFHNFNREDSFFEINGAYLCPKCHPENDEKAKKYVKLKVKYVATN